MIKMIIDESPVLKMGILFENQTKEILQLVIENKFKKNLLNQIYSGKIIKVVDSLDAAFVDIGISQNAFMRREELLLSLGLNEKDSKGLPLSRLVKAGQMIIGKVSKESYQSKGPLLSADVSISGEYSVFLPFSRDIKISKKLHEGYLTVDLKAELLTKLNEKYGVIVRSYASNHEDALIKEVEEHIKLWEKKYQLTMLSQKVGCLYDVHDFYRRLKEHIHFSELDRVWVANQDIKDELIALEVPKEKILLSKTENALYIENNLNLYNFLTQKKKTHRNGLSVTVDELEAFTIVDVNSGSLVSNESKKTSSLKINLLAAEMIEKELLRHNMSGVILIDFIDMRINEQVQFMATIKDQVFKREYGFYTVGFTKLGLFEMTKKRESPSYKDLLSFDFEAGDFMYHHLNELYYEILRMAAHTNTQVVHVEVVECLYSFLKQHHIFADVKMGIHIKSRKAYNQIYTLNSIDKHNEL